MDHACYYEPIDPVTVTDDDADGYEYFQPTGATVSVWAPTIQHGGPPAGLLMRALERCAPDPTQYFTRITTEILGPIGLGRNRVRARVIRPGRQISLISADLEVQGADGGYRVAAQSIGWRLRSADSSRIEHSPVPPLGDTSELDSASRVMLDEEIGFKLENPGFIGTTPVVRTEGRVGKNPAIWIRAGIPLVAGETPTDLASIFTVLDVANGVGADLRPDEWSWMNTDTTVHLTAPPTGPWLGIDADMARGRHGFGATFADLYDVNGFIGRSAQTVLLAPTGK